MEIEREIAPEIAEKELGKMLNFFGNLTKELIKRYNEFHRMCDHYEKQWARDIELRLTYSENSKKSIYKKYEEKSEIIDRDIEFIERDIKFIIKQLNSVKKTLLQKQPTAREQARIDAKNDL